MGHAVSPSSSPQLQYHLCLGYRRLRSKCKANSVPHARINICNYPKLKVALTFTLKLLIEINSKGLDLKGPGFSIRFLVDGKNLRRRRRMDNVHRRHKLVGGSGGHSPQ